MKARPSVRPAVAVLLVGVAVGLAASRIRRPSTADSPSMEEKLVGPEARAYIARRVLAVGKAQGPPVQTDPAAADYDPRRLIRVVGIDTLFRAEPRNDAWASAVEKGVAPRLETAVKALISEVESIILECRTTICAVEWGLPQGHAPEVEHRLREVVRQLFPGTGKVVGARRFVAWENQSWRGDVRNSGEFIAAALAHIEDIEGFLSSPAGADFLTQASAVGPPPAPVKPAE